MNTGLGCLSPFTAGGLLFEVTSRQAPEFIQSFDLLNLFLKLKLDLYVYVFTGVLNSGYMFSALALVVISSKAHYTLNTVGYRLKID
jgi:hypothetical protein